MIPTGCRSIDLLLGGGLPKKVITQIYGPAGSGKTNLCLFALYNAIKQGKKVVFVDSEGSFYKKRLEQICGKDLGLVLDNTFLYEVNDFGEQSKVVDNLESADLIIVDSMTALYRVERDNENFMPVNKELAKQMIRLLSYARNQDIPVLVTNQVYSDIDTGFIEPVGGDTMKYSSKIVVELQKNGYDRKAVLKKHLFKKDGEEAEFLIVEKGLRDNP